MNLRAGVGPVREQELAKRIARGDLAAANELAEGNMAWADALAERYCRFFPSHTDDIRQASRLGLVKASRKFRPGLARFTTYSRYWIELNVQQWLSCSLHFIHIPETLRIRVAIAKKTATEQSDPLGVCAVKTWQAACEQLNNEPASIEAMAGAALQGLLAAKAEDGVTRAIDHLTHRETHERVLRILSVLTPKEREVIAKRFGLDGVENRTLSEVGKDMNLSRERIRQIQDRALLKVQGSDAGRARVPASHGA